MLYVIYDNVTDQFLSKYDAENPNIGEWDEFGETDDERLQDAHKFETKEEAQAALQFLEETFKDEEEGVDFVIMPVGFETVKVWHFIEGDEVSAAETEKKL